jgi:hypothetical protein
MYTIVKGRNLLSSKKVLFKLAKKKWQEHDLIQVKMEWPKVWHKKRIKKELAFMRLLLYHIATIC